MTSWELLEETHKRDQERKTAYAFVNIAKRIRMYYNEKRKKDKG